MNLTVSTEINRIHALMDACDKGAATVPVRTIISTLELLGLAAEMIEIELALWKGDITPEDARPRTDAVLRRQMMLQQRPGGTVQ